MTRKSKSQESENGRLDITAWTDAALELLATNGIDGVRVELLAKRLDVTKGSFYWHFKDRDALYESMLLYWRRRTTLGLIERLDRREMSPEARLRRLIQLPLIGRSSARAADVELAIRLWSRRDERARHALEEVDQLRLRYISGLLIECGVTEGEAESRAILIYSYMRVAASLVTSRQRELMQCCEDLLLGTDTPASH
jgi:AcrR family transcriptional regulator